MPVVAYMLLLNVLIEIKDLNNPDAKHVVELYKELLDGVQSLDDEED